MPELLPDADVSIIAQSLKTGRRQTLVAGASQPHYVATGYLLFVQPKLPATILAVAFAADRLKMTGTPVPIVEQVFTNRGDSLHWGVSRSGMLVYAPGGLQQPARSLVLVDRSGAAKQFGTPERRPYSFPRLSPDGKQAIVTLQGMQSSIWKYDRESSAFNRLTLEGNSSWPIWHPDGKRVTYASNRAEPWRLYLRPVDGSAGDEKLLDDGKGDNEPLTWSPDGNVLLYLDSTAETRQDIWMLQMDDRRHSVVIRTPGSDMDARISPDGRWLAYASDETGRFEVYVVPFPGAQSKLQISTDGGREPVWAHNGHELFFRHDAQMLSVQVTTQPTFTHTAAKTLFRGTYVATGTSNAEFDVTPDDRYFLMIQRAEDSYAPAEFSVVLNWFEELKRRVPSR